MVFYPEMVAFGGAERILLALSRHLCGQSIAHQFVLYYLSVDLQAHADWKLPVLELCPRRNPLLKAQSLKRHLRSQQQAGCGTALLVGIQAALHSGILRTRDYALMILDTPSLLGTTKEPQGVLQQLKKWARNQATRGILRRGMRRAKAVITTSQYMANEIASLYGVKSVIARQGGLTPVRAPNGQHKTHPDPLRVLSVSRLEPNKRIDWILRALSDLQRQRRSVETQRSWHLDVVGEGSERKPLESMARLHGLEEQVTFHGYVSDVKLEQLYAGASLFLMPAFQGYGLPALEALARRIPVVVHRESGVSEILHRTPWVEMMTGHQQSMTEALQRMIGRIESGTLASEPLPKFPTESEWAENICRICGW